MGLEVPESVQAFNFWTLWIMGQLWEEFPVPQHFDPPRDVIAYKANRARDGQEVGPNDLPPVELFGPTMEWLLAEGFIRGKKAPGAHIYAAISLTTRGFSVLNQIPHSIAPKTEAKPLGTLMREAAVDHAVGLAATLVRSMFGSPDSAG
jgi:hypothetical protein